MDVIVNAKKIQLPWGSKSLEHASSPWLQLLLALGYSLDMPPLGALLSSLYGQEGDWLVVTPIHWKASHNDASIVAFGDNLLQPQESLSLMQMFAPFLQEEGLELLFIDAGHWLLQASQKPPLQSPIPQKLQATSLLGTLERLDSTLYWQRLFTEVQMFCKSQCPQSSINGLWFYGSGTLSIEKRMVTDNFFLPQKFAAVEALSCQTNWKNIDIAFIEQEEHVPLATLEKVKAQWYWNNMAYGFSPVVRFLRRIHLCK